MTRAPTFRVASYNVHGFVGSDGLFSPHRIAEILEDIDADVVALQEVEHRELAGVPVADWLADALGMRAVRGDTLRRDLHDYGNLVLTRLTPSAIGRHDLSVPRREARGAVVIDVAPAGEDWRVVATHLGLTARERRIQMQRLRSIVDAEPERPVVVAADFNEWRPMYRPERRLGEDFRAGPAQRTFPARRPAVGLDRICARPASALVDARAIANRATRDASDHLPVVATLAAAPDPADG